MAGLRPRVDVLAHWQCARHSGLRQGQAPTVHPSTRGYGLEGRACAMLREGDDCGHKGHENPGNYWAATICGDGTGKTRVKEGLPMCDRNHRSSKG